MAVSKFAGLLDLTGELQQGVSPDDASTLKALGASSTKHVCGLYSWIVLDVDDADLTSPMGDASNGHDKERVESDLPFSEKGRLPLLLCGHYVEHHSHSRFAKGASILAGYATSYDGRGIFQTADTIYVLFGKGFRRPATVKTVSLLPEEWINASELVINPSQVPSGLRALIDSDASVYCDLQMSQTQACELLGVVKDLRQTGKHPGLEDVFQAIESELGPDIHGRS